MSNPSKDYITYICSLYDSFYDDRIENTSPPTAGDTPRTPGDDWMPGTAANHKSLISFQRELAEQGIKHSTSKIKKILITGGLWTTEASRAIQADFQYFTSSVASGGKGLTEAEAVRRIAAERGVSAVTVSVNLPYSIVVYNLENRSSNAKRCARYKERRIRSQAEVVEKRTAAVMALQHATNEDWKELLWRCVVAYEGHTFKTSGRGSKSGVAFSYTITRTMNQKGCGRKYDGLAVEEYGNEIFITTQPNTADAQKLKNSISRSTVELGYRNAVEAGGLISGPKKLNIPGAGSYVFPLLQEIEVIKK